MDENPKRWFRFNLQTLYVAVAIAATVSGVAVVIRETIVLFSRNRDLASFLPVFRGPKPFIVDAVVLGIGVLIVFIGWTYYRSTR